ncbi:conserved exported hypothetical protein [Candidatus Sulfopaludibacter sp. SbA4]|nr:conserved exported hypothetical protein [Candidatus Sulfopaludibacter sp. SbA4]
MTLRISFYFTALAGLAILLPPAHAQFSSQGAKLAGAGATGVGIQQGASVALSSDGSTALVGGNADAETVGAVWVYTRAGGAWSQQGAKLVGTGALGDATQGTSVALSQDGNTAIEGGPLDANGLGAAWVFTRAAGVWTQQQKLVGTLPSGSFGSAQGTSVALSSDGNTAVVGAPNDGNGIGAVWVFTRGNGVWTQQGAKLTASDPASGGNGSSMGWSVAISADGNTLLTGAPQDSGNYGTFWVFTRTGGVWTQQGNKLFGLGAATVPGQGWSVALSSDGNAALVGGPHDNTDATGFSTGAAWVFTRSNGVWTQQGTKLVGTGPSGQANQGTAVALSSDGSLALVGGPFDAFAGATGLRFGGTGATWVFTRSNGVWTQQGSKLVGAGSVPGATSGGSAQGYALAISTDSTTALVGGPGDNNLVGAAWPFTRAATPATRFTVSAPAAAVIGAAFNFTVTALDASNNPTSGYGGTVHFTSTDGAAALPANATLTSGSGTFSATLKTAGSQTITATDTVTPSIAATSAPVAVTAVGQPAPLSANPAAGSGSSQPLTFTFTDPQGYQALGVVNILINTALDGRSACYLAYSQPANVLYLVADDGGTLLPGAVLTTAGSTHNSQCTVSWTASPVTAGGNTLALVLTVNFTTAFAGNKVVYMAARDSAANNSGWQALGTWQVPGGASATTTSAVGMSPASGNGLAQTVFTFNYSDTKGFADLGVENVLVNSALDGRHACYLAYARSINVLYLVNDNGDALLPGQVLNTSGSIANSQCSVSWSSTPVSATGNNLTLTLGIAFAPAFGGNRIFFLAARDVNEANNTGWNTLGTWTVQ